MDTLDHNGGNAEVARGDSNLENLLVSDKPDKQCSEENKPLDEQELNGDLKSSPGKKLGSPAAKRKLQRKSKSNSNSAASPIKSPPHNSSPRVNKKLNLNDGEMNLCDSEDFIGFDSHQQTLNESDSIILEKLLGGAEPINISPPKRRKVITMPATINMKNADSLIDEADYNSTDSEDQKMVIESDPFNVTTDGSSLKSEKSANSSVSVSSARSRKSRTPRGASPGNAVRQKSSVDVTNPLFREPFNYGWKRELVYRATGQTENSLKRMADIYYYTPEGKKVRSYREVVEFLTSSELTIDNFTFFKEPLGVNDPEKEIIRDAKKGKEIYTKPVIKTLKKNLETPPMKKASPKRVDKATPSTSNKISPKAKTPSTFKVKLPNKKGTPKKEMKSPPVSTVPKEMPSTSQWNLPTTKRNQSVTDKSVPLKTAKSTKTKVQEPCSIRCSRSMGLIPNLQCCICLCLYHPACTGEVVLNFHDFVCKNCRFSSTDLVQNQSNTELNPPPLIPISTLSSSSSKPVVQARIPPKLQRIPKSDGLQPSDVSKVSKPVLLSSQSASPGDGDGHRNLQTGYEFFHKHELSSLKPAQNIATMGGRKYIVVPKNNAMAVQPAITMRQEKIGDQPPEIPGNKSPNITAAVEVCNSPMSSQGAPDQVPASVDDKMDCAEPKTDEPPQVEPLPPSENVTESLSDTLPPTEGLSPMLDPFVDVSNAENQTLTEAIPSPEPLPDKENNEPPEQDTILRSILLTEEVSKKQLQPDIDSRQNFMASICAGYNALTKIFQYLKVQELLRAARVSRMWRDLAAHPSLWKTVRMKNSQVTDWDGFADTLKKRGTQHLDLRKMLIVGDADTVWRKFIEIIPRISSLTKLELCRCPAFVIEEVMKSCPQLQIFSALTIKCDSLDLEPVTNLSNCTELRLKAISGMSLQGDLTPLSKLMNITHLSLTSVKDLGRKRIDIIQSLQNLDTLELGECSDFPDKFGTTILIKLQNLERLRLEKGQGSCCTFDILDGISKLNKLTQLELVNFDVKNGFDDCLANCKNIKRLLIIPTYVSQSATSNNMILGGVTELSNNLTHFVWGVTQELLRVTELFIDQCKQMGKQISGDSIPVLKPVPCLHLIEDMVNDRNNPRDENAQSNVSNPQVEILPLPHLQKLLLTALPKTRVKILKIPFHATWRQSISDSTS